MKQTISILLFALLITLTNQIHFFMYEGKQKCLYDDIPENQILELHYQLMDDLTDPNNFVVITVFDPDNTQIFQPPIFVRDQERKMHGFKVQKGGSYRFCFILASQRWITKGGQKRFSFRVKYGDENSLNRLTDEDDEEEEVTEPDNVKAYSDADLNLTNALNKRLALTTFGFAKYQEMKRKNEDVLFEENERVDEKVVYTTVFQIIVIVLLGIFQIMSLRKFFIDKRLY